MFFETKIRWYKLFDTVEAANQMVAIGKVATINAGKKKICIERKEKCGWEQFKRVRIEKT